MTQPAPKFKQETIRLLRFAALRCIPLVALFVPAHATTLTFNTCGGGTGTAVEGNRCRYATINPDYGDRVTSPSSDGGLMQYGNYGEGWTPNVVVDYGPDPTAIHGWDVNYADLWTVIWAEDRSGELSIRMTADPGYESIFYGLKIAGYIFNEGPWPLVIGSLSVSNESGLLWSETDVPVTQDGDIDLSFAEPFTSGDGGYVEFLMDVRNLPVGNANRESIGIDQVQFGQSVWSGSSPDTAPEPASWKMLLPAAAGLMAAGRRLRKGGAPCARR